MDLISSYYDWFTSKKIQNLDNMKEKRDIAVVTGASGGIGKILCESFAQNGYTVIAVDVEPTNFDTENIHFKKADLCSYEEICEVFRFAKQQFGGVHILVNNGAISKFSKSIFDITPEEFKKVIDINLNGSFMCSKQFIEANKGLEYGRIINIASTRWHQNEANWEAYGASKGGLVSLTNTMCVSLADTSITVNAISPGWIQCSDYETLSTDDHKQHPSGRVGVPEDVARMVMFLSAKENDFINGANIIIDGGMTKKMIYHTSEDYWKE